MFSFLITLTWFPKPWCTMEISHPTCTQGECGTAEGPTTPLAFRAALQVLSCWSDNGWRKPNLAPRGSEVTAQRWEEQPCVSTAKPCDGITRTCLTHTGWANARALPPKILAGMTSLLMANWWRQTPNTNVIPLLQMALGILDCAKGVSPLCPLTWWGNGTHEPDNS